MKKGVIFGVSGGTLLLGTVAFLVIRKIVKKNKGE